MDGNDGTEIEFGIKTRSIDLLFTFKVIIIAVVAYNMITAWDEVIDRTFFRLFGLDSEKIWSWFLVAMFSTTLLIVILYLAGIEAHDVLGISETVDIQLTGQKEIYVDGAFINVPAQNLE